MPLELIHCEPTTDTLKRIIRIQADAIALCNLPRAEIRAVYSNLEKARDALSRILDIADGKHA